MLSSTVAAPAELMECDFEEGLCGWTQDNTDQMDWTRHQGPTDTGKTGPKYDHSFMNLTGKCYKGLLMWGYVFKYM